MTGVHPIWLILLSGALALLPLAIAAATCFLKISLVLQIMKNALGAGGVPSGAVVSGLALSLSLFAMAPVVEQISKRAESLGSLDFSKSPADSLATRAKECLEPWRHFLARHSGKNEVRRLIRLDRRRYSGMENNPPLRVLIPAFMLSELKAGMTMALLVLMPFLVIDLAVANVLAGLGMYMLGPQLVSLPLKLLLLISCDGWLLLSQCLVRTYL